MEKRWENCERVLEMGEGWGKKRGDKEEIFEVGGQTRCRKFPAPFKLATPFPNWVCLRGCLDEYSRAARASKTGLDTTFEEPA
jgi:hypothetical protein